MTLAEMYAPAIHECLKYDAGREFLVYILRKLKYCDIIKTPEDMAVRNAGIGILEELIDLAGIRVTVLKVE
jgi:hypothetical protein